MPESLPSIVRPFQNRNQLIVPVCEWVHAQPRFGVRIGSIFRKTGIEQALLGETELERCICYCSGVTTIGPGYCVDLFTNRRLQKCPAGQQIRNRHGRWHFAQIIVQETMCA